MKCGRTPKLRTAKSVDSFKSARKPRIAPSEKILPQSKDVHAAQKNSKSIPVNKLIKSKSLDEQSIALMEKAKGRLIEQASKKQKNIPIKRVKRHNEDLSVTELESRLIPYVLLDKRNPAELNADIFEDNPLHFQRGPETFRKPKKNESINQMMSFKSKRLRTLVRCVKEEECMQFSENLKRVFHKGVFNEDNDTDESVQQQGVARNYTNLRKAVDRYKLRNKGSAKSSYPRDSSIPQLILKSRKHKLPEEGKLQSQNSESEGDINRPVKNIKQESINVSRGQPKKTQAREDCGSKSSNSMEEELQGGEGSLGVGAQRRKSTSRPPK